MENLWKNRWINSKQFLRRARHGLRRRCRSGHLLKASQVKGYGVEGHLPASDPNLDATLLANYVTSKKGGAVCIVRQEGMKSITEAMLEKKQCEELNVYGRGVIYRFPWTSGRTGIMRPCHRGGAIRFLLHDRYLFQNRPLREFQSHLAVLALGIPAPDLLGVCWRRQGFIYSGALATEEMAGTDLDTWLCDNRFLQEKQKRVLFSCGQLIRRLHDTGIFHNDLQLKNIFIQNDSPVLLDFDQARIKPHLPRWRRECNLLRMRRSFIKRGHNLDLFAILTDGYGLSSFNPWLTRLYGIKGFFSDMIFARSRK